MWELAHYSDYECQASDVNPLRSLLVVMATPPRGHDAFSRLVRTYNERPPFNITSPGWWPFKKVRAPPPVTAVGGMGVQESVQLDSDAG